MKSLKKEKYDPEPRSPEDLREEMEDLNETLDHISREFEESDLSGFQYGLYMLELHKNLIEELFKRAGKVNFLRDREEGIVYGD